MGKILIVFGQIIAGYILGFVVPYGLGIGNGYEVIAIPFGMGIGMWLVGMLAEKKATTAYHYGTIELLWAIIGAEIAFAIPQAFPVGFIGLLFPMIGALLGYWIAANMRKHPPTTS